MTYKLLLVEDSEPIRLRLCSLLQSIAGVGAIECVFQRSWTLVSA